MHTLKNLTETETTETLGLFPAASLCIFQYVFECPVARFYLIMSTERLRNESSAAPFSMPFCSKARSMS